MKKNLISVILPIWKPDIRRLKLCLDSLVNQTYSDIEIIIVYKKSPEHDGAFYNLTKGYQDNRLKIVDDKNLGFPSSLNEGITNSSGEYIARIDSDDYCELDRFEKQLEFKVTHKYNVVGSWANLISDNGKQIGKKKLPTTHEEIRKKIMFRNPILHPSVLMDRAMLENIGYYDDSFVSSEDYELWLRAMHHQYKFGNVPEYLVNMGIEENPDSITRGSQWKKVRTRSMKAKNKALLHYGFFKPFDVFYYLLTPFYYFISPKNAMKFRKTLNQI